MQSDLIEDILLELKLLRKLLEQSEPVRCAVVDGSAAQTEKLAAASVLQSFYNGVENILDALAERLDAHRPTGERRHEALLAQMAQPRGDRPAVISPELRGGLEQYLEFRNAYRYGHYFRLDWPLTAALIRQCGQTLERVEADLDHFVREHGKQRFLGRDEPQGLPAYWFAPPEASRPQRLRALGGPCLLACLVGIALGVGISAAVRYGRHRVATQDVPPAEVRKFAAALAGRMAPWSADPNVRHAVGVLGFFDRDDWLFTFAGDKWNQSGDVRGRSGSLNATAVLAFLDGKVRRIEIDTSWDRYAFSVRNGRVARAVHAELPSGAPQFLIEFDASGRPVYLARWSAREGDAPRRERFFQNGRAVLEVVTRADGTIERAVLRTSETPPRATVFVGAKGGLLAPDPNAAHKPRDLPPPTTQPAR